MRSLTLFLAGFVLLWTQVASRIATAQVTLTGAIPNAILPGAKTQVTLSGTGLTPPIRIWNSLGIPCNVLSADGTTAVVEFQGEGVVNCGPFGVWLATAEGPSGWLTLLVDDLPSISESDNNHTFETAQSLPSLVAVDAKADGPKSDYFKFNAAKDQVISIEVLGNRIGSSIDPVLELLDLHGGSLAFCDDIAIGPDARIQFRAPADGDYVIRVVDNKYVVGGRYRLRVGDFPCIDACFPAYVTSETQALVHFAGPNESQVAPRTLFFDSTKPSAMYSISSKLPQGRSSSWGFAVVDRVPTLIATEQSTADEKTNAPPSYSVPVPCHLAGRLEKPHDVDRYLLTLCEGSKIHLQARSYSIGSPTILMLRLLKSDGTKIAESSPGEENELSLDATIPLSGQYFLEVEDLLHRGGPEYLYGIDIGSGGFELYLKNDPKTKERWGLEGEKGALAIDLQIKRTGYEGPIALQTNGPWTLFQATIPANASEHRLYLQVDKNWTSDSLTNIQIIGKGSLPAAPSPTAMSRSTPLLRTRSPAVPYPPAWLEGVVQASGIPSKEPLFAWKSIEQPISLKEPESVHPFPLERKTAEFKDPVAIWLAENPSGFSVTAKLENDIATLTIKRTDANAPLPTKLSLFAYGEFQQRGRIEMLDIPIQSADPVPAVPTGGP